MARHLGQSISAPADLGRMARWMVISVIVHIVLLFGTSIGFIANGFKTDRAVKAEKAAAATPVVPTTAAAPATTEAPAATDKPSSELPKVHKPKDADAELHKDDAPLTTDELKSGPSLDIE